MNFAATYRIRLPEKGRGQPIKTESRCSVSDAGIRELMPRDPAQQQKAPPVCWGAFQILSSRLGLPSDACEGL